MRFAAICLALTIHGVAALANSCSNVHMVGSTGQSYFHDGISTAGGTIYASGVFLRTGETDEDRQSHFNLSGVSCEKQVEFNDNGLPIKSEIKCEVRRSYVYPSATDKNICFLDFEHNEFKMQELNGGRVISGSPFFNGIGCYQDTLIINRDTQQVTLSHTKLIRSDCVNAENALGFKYQDTFSEVLQECPKNRQY